MHAFLARVLFVCLFVFAGKFRVGQVPRDSITYPRTKKMTYNPYNPLQTTEMNTEMCLFMHKTSSCCLWHRNFEGWDTASLQESHQVLTFNSVPAATTAVSLSSMKI